MKMMIWRTIRRGSQRRGLQTSLVLASSLLFAWMTGTYTAAAAQKQQPAVQVPVRTMPLTLPEENLPDGFVGLPFGSSVTAVGGSGLYSVLVSGDLPPGMVLARGGGVVALVGTPTREGTYVLRVAVTDISLGTSRSHDYSVRIGPELVHAQAMAATVTVSDTESLHFADVPSVFFPAKIVDLESFSFSDGDSAFKPAGIALGEAFHFGDVASVFVPVFILDSEAFHLSDTATVTTKLGVDPATTPAGTVGVPYSQTFKAVGNTGTASLNLAGSLPTGLSFSCTISSSCTVSGTPHDSGTFLFSIVARDSVNTTTLNYSLGIAGVAQTINVGTLPTPTYGGAPFSVSATATSGLPVTIAYVSGPATGSGTGPYTATGAGVVNFTATQAGNSSYTAAAPVNFSVTVSAASQSITVGALPTPSYGGAPFSVSATSTSGLPVTIAYVSGPATGSGSGPYTATGGGVVNFTATQAGNSNYAAAAPVNFNVTIAQASQTINIAALPTPTYGGSPFSVSATSTSGLPVTIAYVSGPATGSGSGPYTTTGGGAVNFTATQAGNANYAAAAPVNFSVTIAAASQTINVGTLPTPTYGGAAFSVSATSTSGLPVTITRTSGPAIGSGGGPYISTGAGTVNFTATQAGNASYLAATPVNFSVAVGKQASVTAVSANPTSITPVQTITLTASVSAAATGSPTGTVTFFDNGVPIGSAVALVGGQAQLTTLLLSGAQLISATYSGDANFVGSSSTTSATVSVAPLDFTMTPLSPVSLNVVPGSAAVVSFNVTPLYLIYPGPVSFSVTGLPSSATYTVTPTSVAANGGPQTVTVTIQTKAATARNSLPSHGVPIALALFVPLLALGALRRGKRWMSLLVLLLGVFAGSAVVGCGSSTTGNGFFGQSPQTYPVVITATSGTMQHTINVSLLVQ
jgi:hypothetical protein